MMADGVPDPSAAWKVDHPMSREILHTCHR